MKFKDDVIIIGSGIGGLSCAASLAKNGCKVGIYERLNQPGGYVNTFRRGDYWFEGSTHQLVGFNNNLYLKQDLKKIGIDLSFIELEDSFESIQFDKNFNIQKRFHIRSGWNNAINSFLKNFNNEKKNINYFFKICKKISDESLILRNIQNKKNVINIFSIIMASFLKNKISFFRSLGFNYYKTFFKFKNSSYFDLLKMFTSKDLQFIFSLYCYYYIQSSPQKISSILMSHLINNLILNPPVFIKGGTKIMIDKFIKIIKKNNGDVYYKNNVKEIIIKDKKAIGIILENGEKKYADFIISNSDVFNTYNKLIKKTIYSDEFSEKLNKYKPTKSAFLIYIGLPYLLSKFGFNASTFFFNNTNNINCLFNNESENNSFILTNYSKMDQDFSPSGKSSLVIKEFDIDFDSWKKLSKTQYKKEKEKKQNIIINKVQKITGIPLNEAEIVFSATPLTMEHYSGNINGSIYGVEKSMNTMSKFDNKSFIDKLYLVGADIGSSGSIPSSIYSGIKTADDIIKHKDHD